MWSVKHYSRQQVKQESEITPGSDNNSGESDDECFFPMPTAAFDQPDMLPEMNLKDYFPDGNDNVHDVVYNADYENESPLLYTVSHRTVKLAVKVIMNFALDANLDKSRTIRLL
ncbi:unnamed protein product, partial [Didymodactylos carnosus]